MVLIDLSSELLVWKTELMILPDSSAKKKKSGTYRKAIRNYRRQIQNFSIHLIVVPKREVRKKWRGINTWLVMVRIVQNLWKIWSTDWKIPVIQMVLNKYTHCENSKYWEHLGNSKKIYQKKETDYQQKNTNSSHLSLSWILRKTEESKWNSYPLGLSQILGDTDKSIKKKEAIP